VPRAGRPPTYSTPACLWRGGRQTGVTCYGRAGGWQAKFPFPLLFLHGRRNLSCYLSSLPPSFFFSLPLPFLPPPLPTYLALPNLYLTLPTTPPTIPYTPFSGSVTYTLPILGLPETLQLPSGRFLCAYTVPPRYWCTTSATAFLLHLPALCHLSPACLSPPVPAFYLPAMPATPPYPPFAAACLPVVVAYTSAF